MGLEDFWDKIKIPLPYSFNNHLGEETSVPTEIFDVDKFVELSEQAEYCAIKRLKEFVKLKLRTSKRLYTLKMDPLKAEEIVKKLRCEIQEL